MDGDGDGFAELFHGQFTTMTRLAAALGADDPEDVAQEAFVRLHRSVARLRDPHAAVGYLRATVVNLTRSRVRHLGVVHRNPVHAADPVDSAEQVAVLREDTRTLVVALGRLSARHREALVLRYWLDLTEAEMAEAMGVSRGTVKSHVSRGLHALTALMGGFAMTDIETRLQDALTDLTENVQVRGDAWQEHQRRRAVSASRVGSRLLLVAAAVIVVLVLVGGLIGALNGKPDRSTPAHGSGNGSSDSTSSDEVFADRNLLGPIVEVETVLVGGVQAVHEAALSDTSGKGPSLCDRITTAASASGSCTSRVPGADEAGVAFDWLSGTTGSGDIRGVLAGVDKRVAKVRIWMDNGGMTLADLKPGGWEGTKLFALTVPADGPRPQRLVAYSDASGTVLQAVDLPSIFGRSWSRPDSVCAHPGSTGGTWPIPGAGAPNDVSLGLGGAEALVSMRTSAGAIESACLDLGPTPLAGWIDVARTFVGVAGPEVALVQIRRGSTVVSQVKASTSQGTPFQVAVLRDLPTDLRGTEVVAVDVTGHVIDRVDYRPRSDR